MENVQVDNNAKIEKALRNRRITFISNMLITFVSISGVLALMVFNSFLDNILEGTKKIVFFGIIIFGLLFWLAFALIDRLVKIDKKEELYLSVAGGKKEYLFYKKYPNPNDKKEELDNENDIQEVEKYVKSKKVILFSIFSDFGDIYSVICVAFFVVAIVFCFFLFPASVVGECMEPLLYPQSFSSEADKIIALKNSTFENGDVVVFQYDYDIQDKYTSIEEGELLIKRIIASPGQSFEVKNGIVYVDGKALTEDYVKYPYNEYIGYNVTNIILNNTNKDEISYNNDNIVPQGYYILLGDNRVVANDSRYFGLVREDQICGIVKVYKNQEGWHKIKEN